MSSRYCGSQAARLRRRLIDRLSAIWRTRLRAKWRTTAMFLAPWPVRRRDRSSRKVTSKNPVQLVFDRPVTARRRREGRYLESAGRDVGSPLAFDLVAAFDPTLDHGDG